MLETLKERLADYAHSAWSGWMHYMLQKLTYGDLDDFWNEHRHGPRSVHSGGSGTCRWAGESRQHLERWIRQMNTTYDDLPEEEKKSDIIEAEKMIEIFRQVYIVDQQIAIPRHMDPLDKALKLAKLLGTWLGPLDDHQRVRVISYAMTKIGIYCSECGKRLPCPDRCTTFEQRLP